MTNLDEYEQDILQSVENSVPYQNLIQVLIHQFASNKIYLNM